MSGITFIQYNVQKSDKVLTPFFEQGEVFNADIVAVQEPPTSGRNYTASKPNRFHLVMHVDEEPTRPRAVLYVNKKLSLDDWYVSSTSRDRVSIMAKAGSRWVEFHSVYSIPPGSTSTIEYDTPLNTLRLELGRDTEHLVAGDFNLHHPWWGGVRCVTSHSAADRLIEVVEDLGMDLITPEGLITRSFNNQKTTIDLAFGTDTVLNRVLSCDTREDLRTGSDHLPIFIQLDLDVIPTSDETPRRLWRHADTDLIRKEAYSLEPLNCLDLTPKTIEGYTEYMVGVLRTIIDKHVPPGKRSSGRGAPWWNQEIAEIVKEERRARRRFDRSNLECDKEDLLRLNKLKGSKIDRAKKVTWRKGIEEATKDPKGLSKMAKWARTRANEPHELPKMPPLKWSGGIALSLEDKAKALAQRFYPESRADLSDIRNSSELYSTRSLTDQCSFAPPDGGNDHVGSAPDSATTEDARKALYKTKSWSWPGNDGIPNGFLKALGEPLLAAVASLTTACWKSGYYPKRFRVARTVVLRKPGKKDYAAAGSWRPIALLNTIGKMVESMTADKLTKLAEDNGMLPDSQMGARKGRSTETALELLTEQVRTAWGKDMVASMLSMDISGAFDTVDPTRLLDAMRSKGVPMWLVRFTGAFMKDRETTLLIHGKESDPIRIPAGVPQGSALSVILFLFYNTELLDICENDKLKTTGIGFVDDANLVAFGRNTEETCLALEKVHEKIMVWAKRFGAVFAPQKYELIHFTRKRLAVDMSKSVRLGSVEKGPSPDIRMLGVQLDSKLKWTAHTKKIKERGPGQVAALGRIAASTWGASFKGSRQVYHAVFRSGMLYAAGVWHKREGPGQAQERTRLGPLQNKCLRTVAGAYRATPIKRLEVETYTAPIDLQADGLALGFQLRLEASGMEALVKGRCNRVKRITSRGPIRRIPPPTPGQLRKGWVQRLIAKHPGKTRNQIVEEEWKERHALTRERPSIRNGMAIDSAPTKKLLELHKGLRKAESSVIVHARTGVGGVNQFLKKANVPGIDSARCRCGAANETFSHIALFCGLHDGKGLRREGRRSWQWLVGVPEGVRTLSKWLISSERLAQFSLAREILYE